jgi:pimeloyl-ACP methyl ester carboxylesterase
MQVCFSHGKESGPWGSKIQALADLARQRGLEVVSLDYRGMDDPEQRTRLLVGHCQGLAHPPLLVGSSMGGYVAVAAAREVRPRALFLMAPALYMPGYEFMHPSLPECPVVIVHGWRDTVVPLEGVLRFARETHATLHVLDDDHRLSASIPTIVACFGVMLDFVI